MKLPTFLAALATYLLIAACGQDSTSLAPQDDTAEVQSRVDVGGLVAFDARTYRISRTIVISRSGTTIQGAGPGTQFVFQPQLPQIQCVNDRAFTTPCELVAVPRRRIVARIAPGDLAFQVLDDVSDLQRGDWLIVTEKDRSIGDVIAIDWVQVDNISGTSVAVRSPIRTAFSVTRSWDADFSGLGFRKLPQLVENISFLNFSLSVPDSGQNAPGISVFAAMHTLVSGVRVDDANGQALYSYLSKDLTIRNSIGNSGLGINEMASTVDLEVSGNTLTSDTNAGLGLDLGTGFFSVSDNLIANSYNAGVYLLYGVHDGSLTNNIIAQVHAQDGNSAIGILARGTQATTVINNILAGGDGANSLGMSIGPAYRGEIAIPSHSNIIIPNEFGPAWSMDYDSTNAP